MKRFLLFATCMLAVGSSPLWAQGENATSLSSTVPDSARFEVVQSPLLAKLTFRLDRFTGDTWQFVSTKDKSYAWERIKRIAVQNDTKVPGKVKLPDIPQRNQGANHHSHEHDHRDVLVYRGRPEGRKCLESNGLIMLKRTHQGTRCEWPAPEFERWATKSL